MTFRDDGARGSLQCDGERLVGFRIGVRHRVHDNRPAADAVREGQCAAVRCVVAAGVRGTVAGRPLHGGCIPAGTLEGHRELGPVAFPDRLRVADGKYRIEEEVVGTDVGDRYAGQPDAVPTVVAVPVRDNRVRAVGDDGQVRVQEARAPEVDIVRAVREVRDGVVAVVETEGERVRSAAAGQGVRAGAAVQGVVVRAAIEHVDAGAALQRVRTGLAVQGVVAGAAVQPVVAGAAADGVVAAKAIDQVVAGRADEGVAIFGRHAAAGPGAVDDDGLREVVAHPRAGRIIKVDDENLVGLAPTVPQRDHFDGLNGDPLREGKQAAGSHVVGDVGILPCRRQMMAGRRLPLHRDDPVVRTDDLHPEAGDGAFGHASGVPDVNNRIDPDVPVGPVLEGVERRPGATLEDDARTADP